MEKPIAKLVRNARKGKIDLTPLSKRIRDLLDQRNESMRTAALNAGLDHQFVRRIINGERPNMIACILLADYFDLNPNELLQLAQWPTLKVFDIAYNNHTKQLPPEAVDLAYAISDISNAETRRKAAGAFRVIVNELKKLA